MSFPEFFEIVTGNKPFQWQTQVADHICNNDWYDALGTPPATGKTSFVEIWYYSLYHNICTNPNKRHIPLRLWYVVDRKIIVDGAKEAADNLLTKLQQDRRLIQVGEIVKSHFDCKFPLFCGKIRGGMDRDEKNKWLTANSPVQPTIITTTVDQYGSRLLFRGYGISPKTRSIHAAMAGMDSVVALDEAHLSQSLRQLLKVVEANHKLHNIPTNKVVELTATGSNQNVFPVNIENDPLLTQRLSANRNITQIRVAGNIADNLTKQARILAAKNNVVAIICNTVGTARQVFAKFQKVNSILLIGRIRNHEREIIYSKHLAKLIAKRDRINDKPLIVVSTQTIEVGADFDFDAMVTQAAPLDCLIQRFGRLDRLGKVGSTTGIVVFKKGKDQIYGELTQKTFDWLETNNPNGFDIGQIPRNIEYFAKIDHISKLTPNLLEVLSLTHPATPVNVEGLLHGVKLKSESDFQLVYRNEITEDMLENDPKQAEKWLEMNYHIQNQEILSLPIYCLAQKDCADATLVVDEESKIKDNNLLEKLGVRHSDGKVIKMRDVVPGDLIIVPTTYGQYDEFGWNPDATMAVEDVSDYYTTTIRLHPDWLPGFKIDNYRTPALDGAIDVKKLLNDLKRKLVPLWLKNPNLENKAKNIQQKLHSLKGCWIEFTPDNKGAYLMPRRKKSKQELQNLNVHNAKVGANAKEFAKKLNFSDELIAVLEKSGKCHDLGKADERFQQKLYYPQLPTPILLAKSKEYRYDAPQNYPKGWRHELQSLVTVLENNLGDGLIDKELFHHLIASHHGWFRNFIPLTLDPDFKPFVVNDHKCSRHYLDVYPELDRNEFFQLNEKYGYWGLALLESILRLADWTN